jgi:hypothetical protein
VLALFGASCGGGGSAESSFELLDANVKSGTVWQINRPIVLRFNRDLDFASVNLNTIGITQEGGGPASGEFSMGPAPGSTPGAFVADPRTIVFQPACPKLDDFSDAGFLPGGAHYVLDVKRGIAGVRSSGGETLLQASTIPFTTPNSTQASVVFMDPALGPPLPRIYDPAGDPPVVSAFSYVEIGGDPEADHGVRFAGPRDSVLGSAAPADFVGPLNLYSDATSRVAIVVELNQPVNPATSNVNADNIRLEYLDGPDASSDTAWKRLPHEVALVANCTATGARVRIQPIGILPQGRVVRVVLTSDFKDLVSDANPIPVVIGSFTVGTALDPGTSTPGVGADELLETFDVGNAAGDPSASLEDSATPLLFPRAQWGGGDLSAAFAFGGTGGPGGDFDWQVGDDTTSASVTFTLDTTFTLITNTTQTATQPVVNGKVDVRNFTIKPNGKLTIQGQNACKILASGTVTINGQLIVRGTNNPGVQSFDSTNIAEPGAAGQAGGGRGGGANYLTSSSTPIGEAGYGAFNTPGGGGGGGESGYSANGENNRRPGGGGGGRLGADATFVANTPTPPHPCPDQSSIGLDAEPGFRGAPNANGALHPIGTPPAGGALGPRPFFDNDATNDFWGTMLASDGHLIQGELVQAWAGAGGGGGGNACDTSHFPTTPWTAIGDEKGAGGGGGGGSLTIFALGDIVIGRTATNHGSGRIDASGGTGGGGENTNFLNHVGGGSGGGSGGHVVLQTASSIDFTRCRSTSDPAGGIYAFGGQGGQGYLPSTNNGGGGAQGGLTSLTEYDALPANAYPSSSPSTPCPLRAGFPPAPVDYSMFNPDTVGDANPQSYDVDGGGDGGPGIIQLHVSDLANIKPPVAPETFYKILKPPPIGTIIANVNQSPVGHWGRLLPLFGPKSQGLSKWIPLGAAGVAPTVGAPPKIVTFLFDGTDRATGEVRTSGAGAQASVIQLPAILSGPVAAEPAMPFVALDKRTIVFDASALSDDIYTRNPNLLAHFELRVTQGSSTSKFDVASASYDAPSHQLRVTVSAAGMPLGNVIVGNGVELRPRFFRVSTQGVLDSLPQSPGPGQPGATIKIEFQATRATLAGLPDETAGAATMFETDIARLSNVAVYPAAASFAFFRFRVTFDLLDGQGQLSFSTPVPTLEFFRMPFKF